MQGSLHYKLLHKKIALKLQLHLLALKRKIPYLCMLDTYVCLLLQDMSAMILCTGLQNVVGVNEGVFNSILLTACKAYISKV